MEENMTNSVNENDEFDSEETKETEKKDNGLKIKLAIGLSFVSGALITLAYCNHKKNKRDKKLRIALGEAKLEYGNQRVKSILADVMPMVNKRYIVERFDDFSGRTIGTLDEYLDDLASSGALIKKLDVKEV